MMLFCILSHFSPTFVGNGDKNGHVWIPFCLKIALISVRQILAEKGPNFYQYSVNFHVSIGGRVI